MPVSIAGIHEFPHRVARGWSPLQIKAHCANAALADAGLTLADVDALYDAGESGGIMHAVSVAQYLGIEPRVVDSTDTGGSAFEVHVAHAVRDLEAGRARVALLTYGSTMRSRPPAGPPPSVRDYLTPAVAMERPWGLIVPASYGLLAARHAHEYGTTPAQLAQIAVDTRAHALRNLEAVTGLADLNVRQQGELTVDDVLGSPLVADPLHVLDCCLVSDGGGAVVLVAGDLAPDRPQRPVWVLGTGEAVGHVSNGSDITTTAGAISGPQAFAQAGVTPADIDVAMLYDSFTITVLVALEDLGFCAKGEGGPYVEDGRLRWDRPGAPALNTDGGGLSSTHPGMRGIFLLIEAVRQLRGESTAQVPDAELAVAHGTGGTLGARHVTGTVVLGKERA